MCPAQRWAMPEASKAYASWRAPGTGSPTSTSRPAVSASTCTLNPHSWCLSENMFASAPGRSPVGATNPSTRNGGLAAAALTCATKSALTAPSSGYSIVNSREMLDWEQPNSSPATSWELLWRNRNSVSTTARYRPMTLGRPTGGCHTPTRAATAVTRSVTCSWARPVIRSHRGGRPSVISLVHTTQVIYRRTAVVTRSDTPRFDHSGQSGVLNNAPGTRSDVMVCAAPGGPFRQNGFQDQDCAAPLERAAEFADDLTQRPVVHLMLEHSHARDQIVRAVLELGINEVGALQNDVRCVAEPCSRLLDDTAADVVTHHRRAATGQRFRDSPGATSDVQHPAAGGARDVQRIQRRQDRANPDLLIVFVDPRNVPAGVVVPSEPVIPVDA